ncbi:hypothetical protein PENTCL1PPCAC_190, partial [Pristionchus entomophagus]
RSALVCGKILTLQLGQPGYSFSYRSRALVQRSHVVRALCLRPRLRCLLRLRRRSSGRRPTSILRRHSPESGRTHMCSMQRPAGTSHRRPQEQASSLPFSCLLHQYVHKASYSRALLLSAPTTSTPTIMSTSSSSSIPHS